MKRLLFILLFAIPFLTNLNGQNIETLNLKIDSVEIKLEKINKQIKIYQDKKNELKKVIATYKSDKNRLELEQELLNGISVKITLEGNLRDAPSVWGNIIIKIPPNENILVYNWFKTPYFKASYGDKVGYISYSSLEKNDKLNSIINKGLKISSPELDRLTKRYGLYTAIRLIKGQKWIGMTTEMAMDSLGYPDDINKSTGSWGVHEQWVYDKKGLYLYFENGKLTSYQN